MGVVKNRVGRGLGLLKTKNKQNAFLRFIFNENGFKAK